MNTVNVIDLIDTHQTLERQIQSLQRDYPAEVPGDREVHSTLETARDALVKAKIEIANILRDILRAYRLERPSEPVIVANVDLAEILSDDSPVTERQQLFGAMISGDCSNVFPGHYAIHVVDPDAIGRAVEPHCHQSHSLASTLGDSTTGQIKRLAAVAEDERETCPICQAKDVFCEDCGGPPHLILKDKTLAHEALTSIRHILTRIENTSESNTE